MKNSVEFLVGLFMIAGFLAFGYLALQLGEVSVFSSSKNYTIMGSVFPPDLIDSRFNVIYHGA